MGRLRKNTDELERKGAFDKNPARGRARAAEPRDSRDLGPPPAEFLKPGQTSAEYLQAWKDIVDWSAEIRLTRADRGHVEGCARLLAKTRRLGAKTSDFLAYLKFETYLGLNPASRSQVHGKGIHTAEETGSAWEAAAAGSDGLSVQ